MPSGATRPILPANGSVNHRLPAPSLTTCSGCVAPVKGVAISVTPPSVEITAILLVTFSVIQIWSPTSVMAKGELSAVGTSNTPVMVPLRFMRTTWFVPFSENQMSPSGPAVIAHGPALGSDVANSVMWPLGSMRPILFPVTSVNQRSPSGASVMSHGWLLRLEVGNSTMAPVEASRRPIFPLLYSVNQT